MLEQNCASIVNDEEGVRLFIELVNNCSAKDKKNIVKQYKGHLEEIVNANNVSYVSLVKLMIDTDDTVLIIKSFEEELLQLIPQVLTCKKVFSIIFSLFSPRNNNFNILGNHSIITKVNMSHTLKEHNARNQKNKERNNSEKTSIIH